MQKNLTFPNKYQIKILQSWTDKTTLLLKEKKIILFFKFYLNKIMIKKILVYFFKKNIKKINIIKNKNFNKKQNFYPLKIICTIKQIDFNLFVILQSLKNNYEKD
jgi:ribosomal protein L23